MPPICLSKSIDMLCENFVSLTDSLTCVVCCIDFPKGAEHKRKRVRVAQERRMMVTAAIIRIRSRRLRMMTMIPAMVISGHLLFWLAIKMIVPMSCHILCPHQICLPICLMRRLFLKMQNRSRKS